MLTLFIIPASGSKSDLQKTLGSFKDIQRGIDWGKIHVIAHSVSEVKRIWENTPVKTKWYGVFYDNEWISEGVLFALPLYLKEPNDAIIMMKKEENGKITQSPRMFRKNVILSSESLLPGPDQVGLKYVRMLDGWVMANV